MTASFEALLCEVHDGGAGGWGDGGGGRVGSGMRGIIVPERTERTEVTKFTTKERSDGRSLRSFVVNSVISCEPRYLALNLVISS